MSSVLQGNNCIFKVFLSGDYFPLICAKSFTLTTTTDVIETTTKTTGQFKSYDYNALSYTISFDGILKFANPLSENGIFDILNAQINFIELGYKLFYTNPEGTVKIITGSFIITQTAIVAAASQNVAGTISFQGNGAFAIDAPDADCNIVISAITIVTISTGVTYNFTPVYTGGPATRFDYSIDGGAFTTVFSSSWNINMGYGAHLLKVIPYCSSGLPAPEFDDSFVLVSPP